MEPLDQKQSFPRLPAALNERRLSRFILGVLVVIAAALIHQQFEFDASLWQERARSQSGPQPATGQDRAEAGAETEVDGLLTMSAAESYDADTLSDKINGKAELYLAAGFRNLETRRFKMATDARVWLERYVYDMGGPRNAFAVYSSQRRRTATRLEFVNHGFLASNGLFFIHGPHYVEIIATDVTAPVQAKMKALALQFVKSHADESTGPPELELFPPRYQVAETIVLIADSAFGLADLDWVYTATYQDGAAQATAFLMRCGSTGEAISLAAAFTAFWTEYGGERVALADNLPNAEAVTILDNFEIVMVQGTYLVGVHEATHLDFGVDITAQLQQRVKEKAP